MRKCSSKVSFPLPTVSVRVSYTVRHYGRTGRKKISKQMEISVKTRQLIIAKGRHEMCLRKQFIIITEMEFSS